MLFILSDELIVENSHPKKNDIMRAVKYIATSVFESKHLLSGSLRVLRFFKEEFRTDLDLYSLFNTIENNYYSTSFDFIKRRVEVVIDIVTINRIEDGFEIFQCSIDEFQDTSWCQKTILLCEDFNDCNFFSYILKWYILRNNYNIHCEFEPDGGGGINICRSIKNHLKNKKILLSIIDTDRKYPTSKTGETYNKCRGFLSLTRGKFQIIALDVQEIENLMPFNLLDNKIFFDEHLTKKKKFDMLRNNNPSLLQYFDIKKGIKKEDTEKDPDYKDFARLCCACIPDLGDFDEYYDSLDSKSLVYPPLSVSIR